MPIPLIPVLRGKLGGVQQVLSLGGTDAREKDFRDAALGPDNVSTLTHEKSNLRCMLGKK